MKILANFDRAIAEVLQEKVRSRLTFKVMMTRNHKSSSAAFHPKDPPSPRATLSNICLPKFLMQGSLDTYRFCDEVWTFQLKNVTFKMDNGQNNVQADKVKIVSCTAKPTGTT